MPRNIFTRIKHDFPQISFTKGADFSWNYHTRTISHRPLKTTKDIVFLLHELGHAHHQHKQYTRDVTLLEYERQAWECAVKWAPKYGVSLAMTDDIVQDALESYREWLHARSCCPDCGAVGIEERSQKYRCLICGARWRANDARNCRLKRSRI